MKTQASFLLLCAAIAMSFFTLAHLLAFVQLLGVHGPLSKRAPGKAFLADNIQASA